MRQIGDAVGLSQQAVKNILDAASPEPARGVNFPHGAESLQPNAADPDQLDIEDAIAAAPGRISARELEDEPDDGLDDGPVDPDHDPVKAYQAERDAEALARQAWGDALRGLEQLATLPSPGEPA